MENKLLILLKFFIGLLSKSTLSNISSTSIHHLNKNGNNITLG